MCQWGASIGAKLAQPESTIVTFIGDGSFEMGKGALDTAYELGLGMIYIVINNGGYSWPRFNQQKRIFPLDVILESINGLMRFNLFKELFTLQLMKKNSKMLFVKQKSNVNGGNCP